MTRSGNLRNFSIIAHIDHGKSTLADRLIERCGGLSQREMGKQVLDSMELERERGITIKAQSACLRYQWNNTDWTLNLIDTPGHVDFSYEVSRSLAACEGAVLLVDATQGVEAQSISTCLAAMDRNLEIIPVLNKMDLPSAEPERVAAEIEEVLGLSTADAMQVSAKTGAGVEELLQCLVQRVPPPGGEKDKPFRALIMDSWFDNYHGVVSLLRVVDGSIGIGDEICVLSAPNTPHTVLKLGVFTPKSEPRRRLSDGEVGFLIAGVKKVDSVPVGDTMVIANEKQPLEALLGFQRIKPNVFASLFPIESEKYEALRTALVRLCLNDSSLHYDKESSQALGFGFRCGFLGTLHMEIVKERLEREYGLSLLVTTPSVVYEVTDTKGITRQIDKPSELPATHEITEIREPIMLVEIITRAEDLGAVIKLCMQRRGKQKEMNYLGRQIQLCMEMPLAEIVLDFFDQLKSVSRGYASFDYTYQGHMPAKLVRVDMLINGVEVDALSFISYRDKAAGRGRKLAERLRRVIPRQMFEVAIQAAIGAKIIARETVSALRKNVTAKCYGGDISRKRKLLDKQKEGKKKMKHIGSVRIPQEAFMAVLKTDDS